MKVQCHLYNVFRRLRGWNTGRPGGLLKADEIEPWADRSPV